MTEQERIRLAIWFSIEGDIRFLSHRDALRLWQRVVSRSGLPVVYSEGFNPHPRISLPLPRSVGMSGRKELFIVELKYPVSGEQVMDQLQGHLPAGFSITGVAGIAGSKAVLPVWAEYRISFNKGVDRDMVLSGVQQFHASERRPVSRAARGRHPARCIDLRESISRLELEGSGLRCRVEIQKEGTARVDELLGVLGLGPAMIAEICREGSGYGGGWLAQT